MAVVALARRRRRVARAAATVKASATTMTTPSTLGFPVRPSHVRTRLRSLLTAHGIPRAPFARDWRRPDRSSTPGSTPPPRRPTGTSRPPRGGDPWRRRCRYPAAPTIGRQRGAGPSPAHRCVCWMAFAQVRQAGERTPLPHRRPAGSRSGSTRRGSILPDGSPPPPRILPALPPPSPPRRRKCGAVSTGSAGGGARLIIPRTPPFPPWGIRSMIDCRGLVPLVWTPPFLGCEGKK